MDGAHAAATIARAGAAFAVALRANIRALGRSAWPPLVAGLVRDLRRAQVGVLAIVESAPRAIPRGLRAWRAAYEERSREGGRAGQTIRRLLHAPALG